ncbi:hypothetical protein ACFQ36_01080 [Arthrobacter sp. GCM10027362]|uniref:hypothetical protein n=1 Tax=Arthrobacter sp. GCM10027362 TaxID=3273379 RepID=UPI003641ED79
MNTDSYEDFYDCEEVGFAAEGLRNAPGGFDPDALEGVLFLGAMALELRGGIQRPTGWVVDAQVRILAMHRSNVPFLDILVAELHRSWIKRSIEGFGGRIQEDGPGR